MSEIFSPGSVAGPAGAAGAAGAAGSLANVKSLTDNLLPNLVNLFDYTRIVGGSTVAGDGTIAGFGGFSVSPLIYCPGALYAISDLPIRIQPTYLYFAIYDANGNFLQTLDSFAGITLTSNNTIPCNTPFPLPGTQTYVRFSWQDGALGQYGGYGQSVAASPATASFVAGLTTPSIPSPYQPFGFATVAAANTKIAAVTASLVPILSNFANAFLPGGPLGTRNAFNHLNVTPGYSLASNGTLTANSSWTVATLYVPNATSAISNIPIRVQGSPYCICTYDEAGNFLADITGTIPDGALNNNVLSGNTAFALPGNQTYLKFCFYTNWNPGYQWSSSPATAVFYAGTASYPPPTSITILNGSVPFIGNTTPRVKTATELGCTIDGSQDATGILNAFLATASSSNPIKLILDGMFPVTGLVISPNGYTTIEGLGRGSGVSLIDGTPQDVIRIGPYTSSIGASSEGLYNATLPARTATNIILRDFTVNTNGQSDAGTDQPVAGDVAHATYGVILTSATRILVDNLSFPVQAAAYALCLSNVGYAKVLNCKFYSGAVLHDGIHIDGPSEDIGISNCDFTTGDDAIALNAPEGFGGDISRVTISDCRFHNSESIMRIYSSVDPGHIPTNNVHKVRNVSVTNCTGVSFGVCFMIGIFGGGYSATGDVDQIQDLLVSNCTFSSPVGLSVISNTAGTIAFRGVNYIPTSNTPVIEAWYSVGELVLDGVSILRNPDGNSAPNSLVNVSGTMDRLSLHNCRVVDEVGSNYAAIPCFLDIGGTVGALRLEAVDLTHVTSLVSSGSGWTHIAAVRGAGVIGTGAQVPDSVMDNNALYLSSDASGVPSIKVGGTAKRLSLT